MARIPREDGGSFCRTSHPILAKRNIGFNNLLAYHFAGAYLSDALLESLTERFELGDPDAIEFGVKSDNIANLRDAVMHSDLILLSTRGRVRDKIAAGLTAALPIHRAEQAVWFSITLQKAAVHPATASLRKAIQKTTCQ